MLGPPKLAFASASRTAIKAAGDVKERTAITSLDGDHLGDRFPREKNERWTRDRDVDRNRDKGFPNGRRLPREDGEGWTSVKGRKSIGQEDFERFTRNGTGDRARERPDGDVEADGAHRRATRERTEPRWGRRDDAKDDAAKPAVQGGWRERDRDRERDKPGERDWHRNGTARAEEEPEWLDTKAEKKEFKPRTQEDFQRWKEQMRAKDTPTDEKDEAPETAADKLTATSITSSAMLTQPMHAPFAAEPTQGILFGNWGRDTGAEAALPEPIAAKPKTDKKSRFMTMFAKPEESSPSMQPPAPLPASPAPVMEPNADKEGFQRILQMLGQVNVGGPAPPQPNVPTHTNGSRHGGGISLDFHQPSPPPEPQHNRPPPRLVEQQSILENILAPHSAVPESRAQQQSRFNSMSPENVHPPEQFRLPRPDSGHPEDQFPHQAPPHRHTPQDANLAAIISNRSREDAQRDQATKQRERDFLLTLMQQPTRGTPPMGNHSAGRPAQENHNMAFFDQSRQQPQQQPKGRGGLPPGFMEDPRMYSDNEVMRRENDRREQELRQQLNMQQQQQQQQEAIRAKNARMQMGFPGHDDPLMGLQRRNTGGDPRLTTNMGIPSQPVPDMQYMGGRGQPGMPPTPQERPNIAPPPGFGGPMRQPPGLGGPNAPQIGPGGPSFSAGNTPLGHPPGFPPPGGNLRGINGMGFPGVPGVPGVPLGNGMPGPPQGYFPPPPGYGPPMPGMRGEDPRMMFEGQFGGPGSRQPQGRPGPPNMY